MAEKVRTLGIDLLLLKPFVPRDLALAVQQVLARKRESVDTVPEVL
jgi:hypothetical protein